MNPNNKMFSICATCLSFHKRHEPHFTVTEDVKEILRCLLHGFDIDEFFQLKPPDKELKLCKKCHETILDMISFKERVLKSFNEFMKFWCSDTQKPERYTDNAPSSTHTATENLLHIKEINPLDLNYMVHDPLDIKQETEYIENIIDIKKETDIIDENNETYDFNVNEISELETVIPIEYEQEQTIQNSNVKTTQNDNNSNKILNNEMFNKNDTPTLCNTARHRNILVINKVTASNVSTQSSHHNAAPNLHNLKNTKSFIIKKVTSTNASGDSSKSNFVKHIYLINKDINNLVLDKLISANSSTNSSISNSSKTALSNDKKFNQNKRTRAKNVTNNNQSNTMNAGNDNSNIYNVASKTDDLEKVIHGNVLFKKDACDAATKTNDNLKNVRRTNIAHMNNTAKTNTNLKHKILETNENIYKRVSDGDVSAQNKRKKMKIIKIDYQGNVENVGEALIKPFTESAQDISTARNQSKVRTASAGPSSLAQTVNEERGIQDSDTSATESEEEFKNTKQTPKTARHNTQKWYIKIVTREEILKKMEERRSDPKFVNSPYKCESCVRVYPTQSLAETHKKDIHVEDAEFTCFACHAAFNTLTSMNSHYYEHLVDISRYYCVTCEFETKHVELMQDHICPNAGRKPILPPKDPKTMKYSRFRSLYYCPKCEHLSTSSSALSQHYEIMHQEHERLKCEVCGKFAKNKYILKYHMNYVHNGKPKPGKQEPTYCQICATWFTNKYSYLKHVKSKHTPGEKKFACDECEKKFLTAKALKLHKEFHAASKTGVKNFKCSMCDRAYYTERVLRHHVISIHERPQRTRNHICEVCGKGFFTSIILKEHSAMHSDERPLKCTFCEDTFKYSGALYTHIKLKHKKKKNGEELRNEAKPKETCKGKGQTKSNSKRRRKVESSNSSTEEELSDFRGSLMYY